MEVSQKVTNFLAKFPEWRLQLETFRKIALSLEDVEETVKWGIPTYTVNGKNVFGFGAFKSYVGLWFFQGALLTDSENVLINAQKGKTKAMRQWRFTEDTVLPEKLIRGYMQEAVALQKAGKTVPVAKKQTTFELPSELQAAFDASENLAAAFSKLSPYKQKEYVEYISSAKRAQTKESRLQKSIPMILEGKGLNDKYR